MAVFISRFCDGTTNDWNGGVTTTAGDTCAPSTTVCKSDAYSLKTTADGSAETQRAYVLETFVVPSQKRLIKTAIRH